MPRTRHVLLLLMTLWMPTVLSAAPRVHRAPVPAPSETIYLWPSLPTNGSTQHISTEGAVSHVTSPHIDIYRPAHPNGAAVLIMGGGGYGSIEIGKESLPAAQWLTARGVTAAVLYYRLPVDGISPTAPFQDAQRAMRLLRSHAAEIAIDPARVGVMGFSAGGNLAGITATRFDHAFYPPLDVADRQSSRPDFVALIYPVISLQPPYNTTQASRRLDAQPDAATAFSVERYVTHQTPPTFLAHAQDDPIANVGNSQMMYDALQEHDVPSELHIFPSGGHGWGMGKQGSPVSAWPDLFDRWAKAHGFFH